MKKILVAYDSRSGNTEKMANHLGEGVRISGNEVEVVKLSKIEREEMLIAFDGYLFGCPTYHKDITGSMKQFLFLAEKVDLKGIVGGAFGTHTHSGESAPMVFETMQYVFKMKMITLGPLNLTESKIKTDDGIKACIQYAKAMCKEIIL